MSRSLAQQFGLTHAEFKEIAQSIELRTPVLRWLPVFVGMPVFIACLTLSVLATNAATGTVGNLLRDPWVFAVTNVVLRFGVAIALAVFSCRVIRRPILARRFRYYLRHPWCVRCDYPLRGLESDGAGIVCPECGRRRPCADPHVRSSPSIKVRNFAFL